MNLDPDEFNAFLGGIAQEILWRRASACPCVNPNSGQAKSNCKHCKSIGRLWGAAVPAHAGVSGREVQKQWVNFGQSDVGDVVLTIASDDPLYAIGPYDRALFVNRTEPFSQNIVKGVNERINFKVVSLERVLYISGDDLIDAPLPAVLEDGSLDWAGVELPDGVTFSIAGRRYTEYYCLKNTPFDRPHHAGAKLPRKVVLRRFDLYANQ